MDSDRQRNGMAIFLATLVQPLEHPLVEIFDETLRRDGTRSIA